MNERKFGILDFERSLFITHYLPPRNLQHNKQLSTSLAPLPPYSPTPLPPVPYINKTNHQRDTLYEQVRTTGR